MRLGASKLFAFSRLDLEQNALRFFSFILREYPALTAPVISVTKDKPVRFSYGFIFIYNLPLACLERQGVLSKISFQDISGSRQKSLCRPARLYVSLAPISLKSGKCQNIRFIIS